MAETRAEAASRETRAAETARDAKAAELVDLICKREAFSRETREAFETCARARDAAKETALAMERALAEANETNAARVAEITASRDEAKAEVERLVSELRRRSGKLTSELLELQQSDGRRRVEGRALRRQLEASETALAETRAALDAASSELATARETGSDASARAAELFCDDDVRVKCLQGQVYRTVTGRKSRTLPRYLDLS